VDLIPLPGQRVGLVQLNQELKKIDGGYVPPTNDLANEAELLESANRKPWSERTAEEATAYNQSQTRNAREVATEAAKGDGVSVDIGGASEIVDNAEAPMEPSAAQGLLIQAQMMKEDAERLLTEAQQKEEQAYNADPSLKPKRGRGRPKKS